MPETYENKNKEKYLVKRIKNLYKSIFSINYNDVETSVIQIHCFTPLFSDDLEEEFNAILSNYTP